MGQQLIALQQKKSVLFKFNYYNNSFRMIFNPFTVKVDFDTSSLQRISSNKVIRDKVITKNSSVLLSSNKWIKRLGALSLSGYKQGKPQTAAPSCTKPRQIK